MIHILVRYFSNEIYLMLQIFCRYLSYDTDVFFRYLFYDTYIYPILLLRQRYFADTYDCNQISLTRYRIFRNNTVKDSTKHIKYKKIYLQARYIFSSEIIYPTCLLIIRNIVEENFTDITYIEIVDVICFRYLT